MPYQIIKTMLPEQRPREKLLKKGADNLTDAELLAIILRTGSNGKSSVDIAKEMLCRFVSFKGIAGQNFDEIQKFKGVKQTKAITIAATFEIARRVVNQIIDEK